LQFIASAIPGTSYPQVRLPFADKIVHFGVYAVLGAACARGLQLTTRKRGLALAALTAALVIGFGASDEFHQYFVPSRSCDWHDLVADALGGFAGALAWITTLGRSYARADDGRA